MSVSATFWVLLVLSTESKGGMLTQRFQTQAACEQAMAWVRDKKSAHVPAYDRSAFVHATCIEDSAPAPVQVPKSKAKPGR